MDVKEVLEFIAGMHEQIKTAQQRISSYKKEQFVIVADNGSPDYPETLQYTTLIDSKGCGKVNWADKLKYYATNFNMATNIARKFKAHNGHGQIMWYVLTEEEYLEEVVQKLLHELHMFEDILAALKKKQS